MPRVHLLVLAPQLLSPMRLVTRSAVRVLPQLHPALPRRPRQAVRRTRHSLRVCTSRWPPCVTRNALPGRSPSFQDRSHSWPH